MQKKTIFTSLSLIGLVLSNLAIADTRPTAIASYHFNNSLSPSETSAFPLTAINPQGTSSFREETVFGESRTVYHFDGNPVDGENAGLALKTTGLFSQANPSYSVEMVVKFDREATNSGFITLVSNSNLQRDVASPLFVTPVHQAIGFTQHSVFEDNNIFSANSYHHLSITLENIAGEDLNHVNIYVDGQLVWSDALNQFNLDKYPAENPEQILHFFADNIGDGADFSDGSIALIRLYNKALSEAEVQTLNQTPFTPSTDITANECTATYSPEGTLHIPCVSVPTPTGSVIYTADIQFVDNKRPFTFAITKASLNGSVPSSTTNACLASYGVDGSLTVPCIATTTVFGGVINYQANLARDFSAERLTFSLVSSQPIN